MTVTESLISVLIVGAVSGILKFIKIVLSKVWGLKDQVIDCWHCDISGPIWVSILNPPSIYQSRYLFVMNFRGSD